MSTKEEINKRLVRKSLSKKIRFEVFKRDMFKCQYCGKSPIKDSDVVLEVDHIVPVVDGGSNEMINLITSCWDCNRGKGARKLDDRQIIVTQHEEIEKLQMENEQYDHLIEYKKELMNVENKKLEVIRLSIDDKLSVLGKSISDNYLNTQMKKLVRKYGVPQMLEVIEDSYNNSIGKYDKITDEEGICNRFLYLIENYFNYKYADPVKQKISYIFGIARNTFHYVNQKQFYAMTNEFIKQLKNIYGDDQESVMNYLIEIEDLLKDGTIKNLTELKQFIGETSEDISLKLEIRRNEQNLLKIEDLINKYIENDAIVEAVGNLYLENELEFVFGLLEKFIYKENCIELYLKTSQRGIYSEIKPEKAKIIMSWPLENINININSADDEKDVILIDIKLLYNGKEEQGISFTLIPNEVNNI